MKLPGVKKSYVTFLMSEELVTEVKIILADPIRGGRTKYGSMSSLGEQLFREWVEKQRKGVESE